MDAAMPDLEKSGFGNVRNGTASRLEPSDLFDLRHYRGVRQPAEVAETLPHWCYTSPEFYRRECETIFYKLWNCVGHVSRVPKPGSYVTFSFLGVPLIIVRDTKMKIHAFINSCRHRGSEIMTGSGECKMMKCPYHAWAFSLEGELIGTPLYEESETFRKADYGLIPVKLELWGGLMWINLDPDSAPLLDYLGDLPARVAPWRMEELVCVYRNEYDIAANWKLYLENYNDVTHVRFVHKETLATKRVIKREFHDPAKHIGNYLMHYSHFAGSRGVPEGKQGLPPLPLPAENSEGTFFPLVYPATFFGFAIDSVFVGEIYPDGPERTKIVMSFLLPQTTVENPAYMEVLKTQNAYQHNARLEDVRAAEQQQNGLRSPFNKPGRFTPQEKLVHDYDLWILDRVLGNHQPTR